MNLQHTSHSFTVLFCKPPRSHSYIMTSLTVNEYIFDIWIVTLYTQNRKATLCMRKGHQSYESPLLMNSLLGTVQSRPRVDFS